jgi:AraC-like DNA-binding protein
MLLPSASSLLCGAPTMTWPAMLATRGPGAKTDVHSHHAMHLVVTRGAPITVHLESGEKLGPARGVLTAPDVPHALDARGAEVLLVFIDPESVAGAKIASAAGGAVVLLEDDEVEHLWGLAGQSSGFESLKEWTPKAVEFLARDVGKVRTVHPRVRAALRHLDTCTPDRDPSLQELADIAGLSSTRFTHAFTESVGVPVRTYLLWRKLQQAVIGIALGQPLAKVALDAGFADAAHMSRTFRRMFGTTPSELKRHSEPALVQQAASTP